MNKDFIVSLTKHYRKFRDKDKRAEIFTHFLAALSLKFIQETQEKLYFQQLSSTTKKSLNVLWHNFSPEDLTKRLDEVIASLKMDDSIIFGKLFQSISFDKLSVGTPETDKDNTLVELLEDLDTLTFGTNPKSVEDTGSSVGYLIEKFTEECFHKDGFLYTPRSIGNIIIQVARLESNQTIYDPAMGIGTLLIQAAKAAKLADHQLYGADSQAVYVELARFNLFFNGIFKANLEVVDSLAKTKASNKRTFDCVLVQPPFREKLLLPANPRDFMQPTKRRRKSQYFDNDIMPAPVKSRKQADQLDFMTLATESMNETGKAILIVPHGLLFKTGTAYQVRRKLVNNNLVEMVIDLPPHVFYSSKINAAILVLNKAKTHSDILFIDASPLYESDRRRNKIRIAHSKQVTDAFRKFTSQEGIAFKTTQHEIETERNNYNLTAKRYVQNNERQPIVDLKELINEIEGLEKTLSDLQVKIKREVQDLSNA